MRRCAALAGLLLLVACAHRAAPMGPPAREAVTYEGVLPCADCAGIRTRLTLDEGTQSYSVVETYLGTPDGDQRHDRTGTWVRLQGSAADPAATVYQLDPDQPDVMRFFLVEDGGARLRLLDRERRPFESGAPVTLERLGPQQ